MSDHLKNVQSEIQYTQARRAPRAGPQLARAASPARKERPRGASCDLSTTPPRPQARVETKRKEVDTERHLKALSQREVGRMEVDINRLQKEQEDLYRRCVLHQVMPL